MTALTAVASALLIQASGGQTQMVIVSGLGGEPQYAEQFHEWAMTLADAARTTHGVPASAVTVLTEDPTRDPTRIAAKSTKDNVERVLSEVAAGAGPGDQLFVVLIGHGSSRGEEAKVNLPGPDMTAADFSLLLDAWRGGRIVFVNTASASGGFVQALAGPDRVIVTATKSGYERNRAVFGRFFVEAYAEGGSDTDKDGRLSVLEAFVFANSEVARAYEAGNTLQSEHAVLDDDGDGVGSRAPATSEGDGRLAAVTYLGRRAGAVAVAVSSDPRLAPLYERQARIEAQIAALRGRKDSMDEESYDRELEDLLVDLALNRREIRKLEEAANSAGGATDSNPAGEPGAAR